MIAGASVHNRPLDARFAKVAALMRSTQHQGERDAARAKATSLAAAAGMTLDQAIAASAPKPAVQPRNLFDDLEDAMERAEPGYKARRAAERIDKFRAWQTRRAAIIARHGSAEAATAPCERERLILAAVSRWRQASPCGRWTHALDGWKGDFLDWESAPPHVLDAIRSAYPLPATFTEAKAEHDYWNARNNEMEDVFAEASMPAGDYVLDRAAMLRWQIVQHLADRDLRLTTLADLHGRFDMLRNNDGYRDDKIEDAIFRDLTAMVEAERQAVASPVEAAPPRANEPAPSVHGSGQVAALIREHMDWTDRRIALAAGCSPTTVGKIRRAIGATCGKRSVQRGGQTYSFNVGDQP